MIGFCYDQTMSSEKDVVEVLPEDIDELLQESPPESFLSRLLTKGLLGKILEKINSLLDRSVGPDRGALDAGVDLQGTGRRLGARMWRAAARKSALRSKVPLDSPRDFAKLLEPLSPAEALLLQKEIESDVSLVVRMDVLRSKALLQQRKGMLVAIFIGLLFLLLAGPDYILQTLYQPGSEVWGVVVFTLGILIPLGALSQIAEGARLIFLYKEEELPYALRAGRVLIALPILSLLILLLGFIPLALVPLVLAWLWSKAEQRQE